LGGGSEAHGLDPGFKRSGAAWEVALGPMTHRSGRAVDAPRSGLTWLFGLRGGWMAQAPGDRVAGSSGARPLKSLAEASDLCSRPMAARRWSKHPWPLLAPPNVGAKPTAEAGGVGRAADDEPRRLRGQARLP
jgi:hypothetical protein